MLHTISVHTGDSEYTVAAQEHALEMARRFGARLRAVSIWDPDDARQFPEGSEDPEELAQRKLLDLARKAEKAGVFVEQSLRKEGFPKGLLSEAQRSDLLLMGMPTEGSSKEDPLVAAMLEEERPLLRKAECAVLVVCRPPQPIHNILVNYQGGVRGKMALRMAGEVALRYNARVTVSSVKETPLDVRLLMAQQYLEGFRLSAIDLEERTGNPQSETGILQVAESSKADMIVLGEDPYGLLDRFLNKTVTEEVVLATELPVLISR
jgi:nucleotide-binding universal stress UspA family protein